MTLTKYIELSDRISALEVAVEKLAAQMECQNRLINAIAELNRKETE